MCLCFVKLMEFILNISTDIENTLSPYLCETK